MRSMIDSNIRAVLFDAVGTILTPRTSVAQVYFEVGSRCGSRLSIETIGQRLTEAFAIQEKLDRIARNQTCEARERQRWESIVTRVFDDIETSQCFEELYAEFALSSTWVANPDLPPVLEQLQQRGMVLGVASNFDHRLRTILEGMPELSALTHLVISSEIEWKKPAPQFYHRACEILDCAPEEVLFIGDDIENDYRAAREAGLQAILFDPKRLNQEAESISSFVELLDVDQLKN